MIAGTSGIGRVVAACVTCVVAWRKTTILLVLALVAASLNYAAGNLGINTDTADMISPELNWRQDFIAYRESFAVRDRNILAVMDGPTAEGLDGFAASLAATLRSEPDLFQSVFLAGDGEFFEQYGLLYLPVSALESLADRLTTAQPLLGLLAQRFNGARVADLVGQSIVNPSADTLDAGSESDVLATEFASSLDASALASRRPIDWQNLLGGPADDSTRRVLLLRPALDFDRIQPAARAIERIREIAQSLRDETGVDVNVRLTGTVAMEHEELVSVTQGARAAGLAALAMVTVVLLLTLRSLVLIVIAVMTLLVGLSFTAAFAALAVGHLNLLSVAFAVLYVGLGVDFILHMMLRFKELVASGLDLDRAIIQTARGVGASLVVCAVTTAAGFFAFVPTEFDGVSELGLIAGTGMFISLVVSVTFLPALLVLTWRRGAEKLTPVTPRASSPVAGFLPPRQIVGLAAVLTAACVFLLPGLRFDSNPIHLRDSESESIRTLQELAANNEAPLFNLVALADDRMAADAWAAALSELEVVDSVLTIDSLVPQAQDDKRFVLEDLELVLGPGFAEITNAPFNATELTDAIDSLAEQLETKLDQRGTLTDAEETLGLASRRLLASLGELTAEQRLARLQALDSDLRSDLTEQLQRLELAIAAEPFTRDELPLELRERWVNERGQELVEIVPAENVDDNAAAERFVTAVRPVVATVTGLPVVYLEASATIVQSFMLALAYAFVMVVALLYFFLRSFRDTYLVVVPIIFAATVTAGLTVWLGLPLNFANIIALPLLVGVGVDSGIHMVHRMRTEPTQARDPLGTSTSRAVFASGLTTIASFGNLAFSAHVGMASMGQLLTLGMVVTLVATLMLLPALMRLKRS